MTVREEVKSGQLAELLKQVQAGHEVLLMKDDRPVARLVAEVTKDELPRGPIKIKSLKGHRVVTPHISHAEIADEMFGQK